MGQKERMPYGIKGQVKMLVREREMKRRHGESDVEREAGWVMMD